MWKRRAHTPYDDSWHFSFLFTCVSLDLALQTHKATDDEVGGAHMIPPPLEASASGLTWQCFLWSVQVLAGLRQSRGRGQVPLQARVRLWGQREEKQRAGVRGAGRAQVLRGEGEAAQLGQRVGALQPRGHGQACQTHAGLNLLSPLTHETGFPPHAAQTVAAGAARQSGAVRRGGGGEQPRPHHPQQGFVGQRYHQWL